MNEFVMHADKPQQSVDGFVPNIIDEIGYGIDTAIDTETQKTGLVPIPTQVQRGEPGQEHIIDNPACYAKAIKFEGDENYTYYVRMNARGDVSDPWGLFADSKQNARTATYRGTSEWEFRRVKEDSFMTYLRYLTTRNKSFLRICEREIKDG